MPDRYASRRSASPGPSSASYRRDRSPPPSHRRRDDDRGYDRRDSGRRGGAYDDDERDYRDRDRDRRGSGRARYDDEDEYDRRRSGGGDGGRRRSPPPAQSGGGGTGRRRSRSPVGGDGGWGKREALPDQNALVPGGGGAQRGGEVAHKQPPKPVEPDFKPSGALAAETKCVEDSLARWPHTRCLWALVLMSPGVLRLAQHTQRRRTEVLGAGRGAETRSELAAVCLQGQGAGRCVARLPLVTPCATYADSLCLHSSDVELFHVHRQSCYLFGRDRVVRLFSLRRPQAREPR